LSQPRPGLLGEIFSKNPIVFDGICFYVEPRDIIALQRTTKQLSGQFDTLFRTQWNLNTSLQRFVADPVRIRSQMARCNALISGSFTLQFFDWNIWNKSDLDVYIPPKFANRKSMRQYLISKGGYQLAPTQDLDAQDDFVERYQTILNIEKVGCTRILVLRSVIDTRLGRDIPKAQTSWDIP